LTGHAQDVFLERGYVAIRPVLTLIAFIPLFTIPIIALFPKTRNNG
jgi:hypothetical protein